MNNENIILAPSQTRYFIVCQGDQDRKILAGILIANGYTVCKTSQLVGKTKRAGLEYWEE